MSFIKIDPLGWVPDEIRMQIRDAVVDFLARQAEKLLGEEVSGIIRKLRSDSAFNEAFNKGLKGSTDRFVKEYVEKDEDLVAAVAGNPDFWQAKSVRQALLVMIQRPGRWLDKDRMTLTQHFDDVLPMRVNRERVDRAVTFFLRCLAEEVWHLPTLQPIYQLQLQRVSVEQATKMLSELRKMRADLREALVALVTGLAKQRELEGTTTSGIFAEPPKVYHNLPWPNYAHFIGRKDELALVRKLLYPTNRTWIIAIDGIGGVGKSSLALEMAHRYLAKYDELPEKERFRGIIWTSAQASTLTAEGIIPRQQITRTLDDIYTTISHVLQREDIIRTTSEEQGKLIGRVLAQQRILLIVDNLETIEDARVNTFLQQLPAPTKCIVTTRHRIDIAYPVHLTGMSKEDGLVMIAQECAKKDVTLTKAESEKLYDRTGGVPLAIVWSIAKISYGIDVDNVLGRLGQVSEDISRFCFERVVEQIHGTDAHRLLMSLSLFASDASSEALGYVTGLAADAASRDEGLAELEKLSLINRHEGRLSLLSLTKEFALAHLHDKPGFQRETEERFVKYYLDLVNSYPRSDFSSHPIFEKELANILHLLDLCRIRGRNEVIAQIMVGIDVFLWAKGHWNEAFDILTAMLVYAEQEDNVALQAHANRALGRIYLNHCDYKAAQAHLENAHQQYKNVGNVSEALSSANYLSIVYAETGNLAGARLLLEDSLNLALSKKEYDLVIRLQNSLADIDIEEGNLANARERVQNVLKMEKKESSASTLGIGLTFLIAGKLAMYDGDFQTARHFFERSFRIARERGIEQDKGYAIMFIANALRAEGRIGEAIDKAQEALEIFSRIGDTRGANDAQWLIMMISEGWQAKVLKRFTRKT